MKQENLQLLNILQADLMGEDSEEMIPLLSPEEEEQNINNENLPESLFILPVRNTVLFPGVVMPVTVGRKKSVALVKDSYAADKTIGVFAQKNPKVEDPTKEDIYTVGTVAKIIKMLVLPDGNITIIIQGRKRIKIKEYLQEDPYLIANIEPLDETFDDESLEAKALFDSIKETSKRVIELNPELPPESQIAVDNIETLRFLTHFLASNLSIESSKKQELLETESGILRATTLLQFLTNEAVHLELKREIQTKAHLDMDQQQRDYYLRQQMRVLQDELGDDSPDKDIERLRSKADTLKLKPKAREHFDKEINRFSRLNPMAAEYPVALNYLEYFVDLPWGKYTVDNFDLKKASKVLDKDHFGLEKVKERILEFLAVLKLKNEKKSADEPLKSPILCLYGPPGVGKTSLGRSIAKALDREYIRMALGGLHDEAEIRGHRKTYIGAMPGKILQNIRKSGSSNPVFVLDEIDKIGSNFKGDPSSALLEVLDPEQNQEFVDNYLEVEYDLSKVLFIATSNSLDTIQPALRDRMEIIEVSGYTIEEKIQIAKRHLVPKQLEEHGLTKDDVKINDKALLEIVEYYTRESGVRSLERKVASVIRYVAKSIALEKEYHKEISQEHIFEILGARLVDKEEYDNNEIPGIVTGLAWTSVGGEILSIESVLTKGNGKLTLSGQLGDVMKESAVAALTNLKKVASDYQIDERLFQQYDLHLHVPAGAVPKDGPSAGITMFTSLASVFTQRKVKKKIAMTGEITLSGKVYPVGGIKEKILAAKRAGIKEIIMCYKNQKDVEEIKEDYIKGLTIHYVKRVEEVLEIALLDQLVKNPIQFKLKEDTQK